MAHRSTVHSTLPESMSPTSLFVVCYPQQEFAKSTTLARDVSCRWQRKVSNWRTRCKLETLDDAMEWEYAPQMHPPMLAGGFNPMEHDVWPEEAALPGGHNLSAQFCQEHGLRVPRHGCKRRREID